MEDLFSRTVIVADGSFPWHEIPLSFLKNAARIICCDGSAEKLVHEGIIPDAIVGDMDSLPDEILQLYHERVHRDPEQESNDLTKSVRWCTINGYDDLVIVGATGKREDHTLGNISLLAEYARYAKVKMITDTGFFIPMIKPGAVESFPGQQVSIFSIDTNTELTSTGLRYPLQKRKLNNWWEATLNESMGDSFTLEFGNGRIIVYLKFRD